MTFQTFKGSSCIDTFFSLRTSLLVDTSGVPNAHPGSWNRIIPDPKVIIFSLTIFCLDLSIKSVIRNFQLWHPAEVWSDSLDTEHNTDVFLLLFPQQASDLLSCKVAERSLLWSEKRVVAASKMGHNQISALGLTNDQWQTVGPGGWAGSRRRVRGCLWRGAQSKGH